MSICYSTFQEEAAKDLRCNYLLARRRVRAFQRGLGSLYPLESDEKRLMLGFDGFCCMFGGCVFNG